MVRQYFNKESKSYKADPWTVDDIKYFDNVKEIFETIETIKDFDSVKYEINISKMPSQGWFNYDEKISTIDKEAFEFWQDLAITYEMMKEHEENIERGMYSKEEVAKYEEDKSYFEKNGDLQAEVRFGFDLPEYNKNVYIVDGKDKYDYRTRETFDTIEEAKDYANKLDKCKIYKANPYELYKATLEIKSYKNVLEEIKDLSKPKKESVLGKIADYKKEEKGQSKTKAEKGKNLDI